MLGFLGDVGDLAKLVQGKEGVRPRDDLDEAFAHELADCLWCVMTLADSYGVDRRGRVRLHDEGAGRGARRAVDGLLPTSARTPSHGVRTRVESNTCSTSVRPQHRAAPPRVARGCCARRTSRPGRLPCPPGWRPRAAWTTPSASTRSGRSSDSCVVTAAQAHLSRELDESHRAAQARRAGRGASRQPGREQAWPTRWRDARRESPHRGRQHLGLAKVVARELPHTWSAWRAGRITEWKATIVARETAASRSPTGWSWTRSSPGTPQPSRRWETASWPEPVSGRSHDSTPPPSSPGAGGRSPSGGSPCDRHRTP